ncbi:MAG: site-specific DNA-methyltransferase [Christensenellaceae bacterium]|jgi:adenine-specific DNA-methyltransferase|nr:site-specific DNA-methyltransferase [Christensenellaceae bacterium]
MPTTVKEQQRQRPQNEVAAGERNNIISLKENNVFIGDNLTIMSNPAFATAYENKVALIYIDPPYNTKNNFSYNDNQNSNEWLFFMRGRLSASRNFLKEKGVIFISIDDSEYANLKILCDGIFGVNNCIGTFVTNQAKRSNAKLINTVHEYVLCYAKNINNVKPFEILRREIPEDAEMIAFLEKSVKEEFHKNGTKSAEKLLQSLIVKYCKERNISWLKNYSNVSSQGEIFFAKDLSTPSKPREVNIPEIGLKLMPLATRGWVSDKKFIALHNAGRLVYRAGRPYHIHYLAESKDNAPSILNFYSRYGTKDLKKLGLDGIFDTPKPTAMIKYFIKLTCEKNDIVMDFFAGCGTTAQAVYEVNEEANLNLNFVLIQKEEIVNKNTEVFNSCIKLGVTPNIASILQKRLSTYINLKGNKQRFNIVNL